MALKLHVAWFADVGFVLQIVGDIVKLHVWLERIECSLSVVVLVCQVEVPVLVSVAQSAGDAVSALPVGIVGRTCIEVALAVQTCVSICTHAIHGRYAVVAQADGQRWIGLQLGTNFQRGGTLQRILGVAVHHHVAV